MKVLILGYGKMGKMIERLALQRGHSIGGRIDRVEDWQTFNGDCDVAIDFSQPSVVKDNIKRCFAANLPVVIGTTGWTKDYEEISRYCLENGKAMLYSSNFSIGVFLFNRISVMAAGILAPHKQYLPKLNETHHIHKLDKPSGTAITLAENLVSWYPNLEINSVREGEVFGIHEISYTSPCDIISIRHEATSREGFALGAVVAAEFILGKTGVFTMNDII
ncbi:MAG: 4-hydroxy-tetrahydrodipicolinate reductase [Bacteroidales bacterium]|jgi:4-hydroxy-tetrahydrodipicolinate reductase|nr:4-hydroxy-tetrahydrodipicolinate reductase [Bacteroidales bacterium]